MLALLAHVVELMAMQVRPGVIESQQQRVFVRVEYEPREGGQKPLTLKVVVRSDPTDLRTRMKSGCSG